MSILVDSSGKTIPLSVNYFPHRKCNYACKFCFHTDKSSITLPLEKAKHGLSLLHDAGMKKINISGGEPFLNPKFLGEIIKFCKDDFGLESTGIICNGSKVTLAWLDRYGDYLDILGVSCDSFDDDTNLRIGRSDKGFGIHKRKVFQVAEWCRDKGIMFKMNTVVSRYNWAEDMNEEVAEIAPFRWKVFQVLLLEGENKGPDALRDATDLVVTKEEFQSFLDRHASQKCLVPENNDAMENSYLLLDEEMRFLNCTGGKKMPGRSILDVGVQVALQDAGWETETFIDRGGIFEWKRPRPEEFAW
ncbi:Radical S-adenosyl methionine domain-containing protein 2 [Hypsizygus marmoreus]|uniref:Radical S-adenosyl methionine domain-containing protein 2 n=1 Tax=Hypsizygus marmoreus TaxID=39966 RepID=A0A369J0R6_HYPMA|nr:Radical S-adenosyl methionine domain-containing protein 2 [Hypsizygus marmoreus]